MKNKKVVISVLAFITVLLIPVFFNYRSKYLEALAIQEQKRIEEEERIAREKEQARIESLPVSKSIYICLEETRDYSVEFLSGDKILEIMINLLKLLRQVNVLYIVGKLMKRYKFPFLIFIQKRTSIIINL